MPGFLAQFTMSRAELDAAADAITRAALGAGKAGLEQTTKQYERKLEAATKNAVPGKLWRAWASKVSPGPGRIARDPAGVIYLNGSDRTRGAMDFFSKSGRIRPKSGRFLAIPLPAAGSRGRGRNLSPQEWERRTGAKLRLVPRRNKPWLLVVDKAVLSGKKQVARLNTTRRRKAGADDASIPIFVLIPERAFSARFSIDAIMAPVGSDLAVNVRQHLGRIGKISISSASHL